MSKIKEKSAFYGNDNLRKYDYECSYTEEQIIEIQRCSEDPVYFIKNYCKIVSIDEGIVNFNLWDYQENFINLIHNNNRVIAKWARQSGKTISSAAYIVWFIIFNSHKRVGILAHQATGAREILSRIQLIYEMIPLWMQAGVTEWNKGSIELDNGCSVITAATRSTGIRGKSCALLLLDEIAFVPNSEFDSFFASVFPTIASSNSAKVIMSSTPDGLNHFYKIWMDAINGLTDYKATEINWYDPPGRDEEFKRKTIAEIGGIDRWLQEFECKFLGAAGAIIKSETLNSMPGCHPIRESDNLRIYEEPKIEKTYIALCDVSEGVGKDSSTIQVIDISKLPYNQVAVYQDDRMKSNLFHFTIDKLGRYYNNALVIVESNSIGHEVCNNLFYDSEYENIFRMGDVTGLKTTSSVKNVGCTELKHIIENNFLILNDFKTISELSNFVRHANGKIGAKKDHHDDLVMPLVLLGYFIGNKKLFSVWFETLENGEINKDSIQKINDEIMHIGWVSNGIDIQSFDDDYDEFGCFSNNR